MEVSSREEQELMNRYGYSPGAAFACVRSNGYCAYCGVDCLRDAASYFASQVDHILPRAVYPGLTYEPMNMVLSCFSCNNRKKNLDILQLDANLANQVKVKGLTDPRDIVNELRTEMIEAIKNQLRTMRDTLENDYQNIKSIIRPS